MTVAVVIITRLRAVRESEQFRRSPASIDGRELLVSLTSGKDDIKRHLTPRGYG